MEAEDKNRGKPGSVKNVLAVREVDGRVGGRMAGFL